jgi:chromosome partitioning protein
MGKQIILAVLANAGGVGKTTLCVHLAYELSTRGISVALIDLDPQQSIDVFCGLDNVEADGSIASVFGKGWRGKWPMTEAWEGAVSVCQGHQSMIGIADELVTRRRGEYTLADRFKKHPLPHQVVILDCPATLGKIAENAIAASTGILVPVQLEMKALAGLMGLIDWTTSVTRDLELDPVPEIIGLVPSMYEASAAIHRQYLGELPEIAEELGIKLYPEIRKSQEFRNASAHGLPLEKFRPTHPANKDWLPLVKDILKLTK